MPRWDPGQIWSGEDAYVIGGGSSLSGFDWGLVTGRHTIGCNSAFVLGSHVIEIVVFGDFSWWINVALPEGIEQFGGRVVGCSPRFDPTWRDTKKNHPWLHLMRRHNVREVGTKALAWYGNTGSLGVNLALILGARRIYLLGFDMKLGPKNGAEDKRNRKGRANWHDLRYEDSNPKVYARFMREFSHFATSAKKVFPGREIWNVTDDSDLEAFEKVSLEEHFHGKN